MTHSPDEHAARDAPARLARRWRRRRAAMIGCAGIALVAGASWAAFAASTSTPHAIRPAPSRSATTGASPRAPAPALASAQVRIAAVGDTMMGSPPWGLPPAGGTQLFSAVRRFLVGDVVMGNLEGTLTISGPSKCGASVSSTCFAFRSPPSYARNLSAAGFTVMNGANNHSFDFGGAGRVNTLAALRRVGLKYTGLPGQFAIQKVGVVKVAILGFAPYGWANRSDLLGTVRALVKVAARQANLVIVNVHAGAEGVAAQHVRPGTEYYLGENRGDVLAFAHTAIDAGAALIVGHGPHVLRGMEFYRHHLIAFSMGNFVGYRAFGLGGVLSQSGVLQVTLAANGRFIAARLVPVHLNGSGAPSPGGAGIALVGRLSRADFGRLAVGISAGGVITPPRGQ